MKYFITFLLLFTALWAYAQNGIIKGQVTNKRNNESVPFASIVLQGTEKGASTDLDGFYELTDLQPGVYNIEVSFIGFEKQVVYEIEVTNARAATANVALNEMAIQVGEAEVSTSAFVNREEAPVSVRNIGVNEVKRNPGGNRDISRAIRSLPGVASTPSFRNDILIRGGAPSENRFYIDGIEIPNINHFATQGSGGGPVGLINVDLIQNVEFYSGAFPANRGNALSSVFDFGFKDGRTDKYTLNAVVGSSDLGITVEGPTGPRSSIVASARRSYLQFLFEAIGLPFLPTYNDFQFKWKMKVDDKNQLTVLGIGAIDQFALNLGLASDTTNEDFASNRYILDFLPISTQWNYALGTKWEHFGENGLWTFVASRNMLNNRSYKHEDNDENLPLTSDYTSQEMENKFRVEHKLYLDKGWKVSYGVNYEFAKYNNSSQFRLFSYTTGELEDIDFFSEFDMHKYGAFGQLSRTLLGQRLVLSGGVRMDGNEYSSSMENPLEQLSPRFAASYYLAPGLSANFNTGIYFQLPTYTVLGYRDETGFVNQQNNIKYIRNKQLVGGLRYDWDERNTVVSVEGFWKDYDRYPFSVDKQIALANLGTNFGVIGNEEITSTATGHAYGAEVLYQQKLYKGFYGIVAYTWVRSEFSDATGKLVPSSWDSQHLVSLTGGKKFKRNWELGCRFQYSGGLPATPVDVEQSMLIPNWNATGFAITDFSRLNSQRLGAYHQLDVRIDKKWFFTKWSLNLFLDIQNLYGFEAQQPDELDVVRNSQGVPVEDPNNPGSYQPVFLNTAAGSTLPSIGLIIEL